MKILSETVIMGNSLYSYLSALIIFIVVFSLSYIFIYLFHKAVLMVADRSNNNAFRAAVLIDKRFLLLFALFLSFYASTLALKMPASIVKVIRNIGLIFFVLSCISYITSLISVISRSYIHNGNVNTIAVNTINVMLKLIIWIIGVIFILSNAGVNITTLIAGLGVGGMALALASQTLLADLFNYFTIAFDRPFNIGDSITVKGYSGTVKAIGLKATRLRSSNGEEITISNTEITKNILQNFDRMQRRRVLVNLSISLETSIEALKILPYELEQLVRSVPYLEFGMCHFLEIGTYSYNFELIYYAMDNDEEHYKHRMQELNYKIIDKFHEMGVQLACPSSEVVIKKIDD